MHLNGEVLAAEKKQAENILEAKFGEGFEKRKIIFLNAGASVDSKEMAVDEWREFLYLLSPHSKDLNEYYFVIDQGANDRHLHLAQHIAGILRAIYQTQYGGNVLTYDPVLPRVNLRIMAALISLSHGALTIDTSVGHIAPALRVPTFVIFPDYESTGSPGSPRG